jgi:hypothetical protein
MQRQGTTQQAAQTATTVQPMCFLKKVMQQQRGVLQFVFAAA